MIQQGFQKRFLQGMKDGVMAPLPGDGLCAGRHWGGFPAFACSVIAQTPGGGSAGCFLFLSCRRIAAKTLLFDSAYFIMLYVCICP